MTIVLIIAILIFLGGNFYAEWINRHTMSPFSNPLSSYIAGVPGSKVQTASYLALAIALFIYAFTNVPFTHYFESIPLMLVLPGMLSILGTKWYIHLEKPKSTTLAETIHVTSAGITFLLITVYEVAVLYGHPLFWTAFLAPAITLLFNRLLPKQTTLEEKTYTLFLLLTFLIILTR